MIFNLLSFVFGVVAAALPITAMFLKNGSKHVFSFVSLSACVLALLCQLAEYNRRVLRTDWSALTDTSKAVILVSAVFAATVIVLNAVLLIKKSKR